MKTGEKTNGGQASEVTLVPPNGHGVSSMPGDFAGPYQEGYEAGLASGRESGFRQGYQAGFGDGRRQGDTGSAAAAAAVENASEEPVGGMRKRLLALPCKKCRRFLYNDEMRCPHCKTPRAMPTELPSAAGGDWGERRC